MGIQTYGFSPKSRIVELISELPPERVHEANEIDSMFFIHTTSVELLFHDINGDKYPNRPYLHIVGEIQKIQGDFPMDVKEVPFKQGNYPSVDVWYEFTNDQIKELVDKGLFDNGCSVDEIFIDNEIEIPGTIDIKVIDSEFGVPISVVTRIDNEHDLFASEATCGYNFTENLIPSVSNEAEFVNEDSFEEVVEETPDYQEETEFTEEEKREPVSPYDEEELKAMLAIMTGYNKKFDSEEQEEEPPVDPVVEAAQKKVDKMKTRQAEKLEAEEKERRGLEQPIAPVDESEQEEEAEMI